MKYKKQRGQKRKLESLLNAINQITPFQNTETSYEHFHVPCSQFISSPKTSGKIKTAFCKAWLKKTEEITNQKPPSLHFCKVVALLNPDNLWESQIIVFYDQSYYDSFWTRDTAEQSWISIEDREISFVRERHIETSLKERGYLETISESDFYKESILWFYEDIGST